MILSATGFVSPPQIASPSLIDTSTRTTNRELIRQCWHRQHSAISKIVLQSTEKPNDEMEDNDDGDDSVFYDDFDFVIGDSSSSSLSSSSGAVQDVSLSERIRATQEQEMYRDTKLLQNWKRGDWSVRGFSLDPHDAFRVAAAENPMSAESSDVGGVDIQPVPNTAPPIHVSKVVPDTNSDGKRVWVGRSNGSLVWVRLGTAYTTHFQSKISGSFSDDVGSDNSNDDEDEDEPSSTSFQLGSDLIREEGGFPGPPEDPFQILAQFTPANVPGGAVSHILSVPDEDYIFTASEGSGQIQQWHISDENVESGTPALQTPVPLSESMHTAPIVALKMVSYQEAPLLLSVGADGSMALWDIANAELIYHCQVCIENVPEVAGDAAANPAPLVHCADANDSHIFVGTASGLVLGYDVQELVAAGSSGGGCPLPQGKFHAHERGVTAIACGGPGSLGRLSGGESGGGGAGAKTSSSVLFTGGGDCLVKQWEMLSSPSSQRLENWPKLASQRLPKKAHLFKGHHGPITAIEAMRGQRPQFLSASTDSTIRTWNVAKGNEEYRMDGFTEDLSSLCLLGGGDNDNMLITNGMNQYVCVHDFSQGISSESIDDFLDQWDD